MIQVAKNAIDKETPWNRIKLMVVGEGGCGKSQTIRSLVNEPFEEKHVSTNVGDCNKIVHTSINHEFKKVQNSGVLNKTLFFDVALNRNEPVQIIANSNILAGKFQFIIDFIMIYVNIIMIYVNIIWYLFQFFKTKNINKLVESSVNILKDTNTRKQIIHEKVDSSKLSVTIWDFGGQNVFKAIHHLFISPDGVYLIVFSLSKMVENEDKELNELLYWIESVLFHGEEPRICIVGTHLDEFTGDLIEISNKIENKIKSIKSEIILAKYTNEIVFFPVDNKGRTSDGIQKLRKSIIELAESNEIIKEKVPLKWIICLEDIRVKISNNEMSSTIELNNFIDFTKEYSIDRKSTMEMLKYCHKMGTILYWENIENVVVLNPQWLINAAGQIIHESEYHKDEVLKGLGVVEKHIYEEEYGKDGTITRELIRKSIMEIK